MVKKTEQSTLLIDAGNSAIKWAVKMGSESNIFSKESSLFMGEEKFDADLILKCWEGIEKPIKILASCVASESVWHALLKACNERWELDVGKVISLKAGFGLTNAYEKPADLGSDRWCAMIGAKQLTDGAFIVIDAGSALTIDMVNESGQHQGGYITPGLNMMRRSLNLHTAQIKQEESPNPTPSLSLANSTTTCVEAGIHLSMVKLIEAVYETEYKQVKKLHCFLTGGNAASMAGLLSFKCEIIPDIVLRGLAEIAT